MLRTNRGLIFGDTDSQNWRYMCSGAWGTPFGEQPDLALLADGRLLAATSKGLKVSADEGCTWQGVEPFGSTPTSSLTQHPADPSQLYVGVWAEGRSGLYETSDAGTTWSKRLSIGPADHLGQMLFAPSEPQRLYASGLVFDEKSGVFSFQITRSTDGGSNWQRLAIPLHWNEDEALLLAVSPTEANTLLVLATSMKRGEQPDRVLITRDGGATFQTLVQGNWLLNGGFSADGKTAFVVGNDAFYRSNAELTAAAPSGDAQLVSCVTSHEGSLYVCGHHSGFDPLNAGMGISNDNGVTFTRMMAFTNVKQTVTCAADSNTARECKQLWTDWQVEVLVGVGGAPLESVPDWRTLDLEEPEPMSGRPTLSSAMKPRADSATPTPEAASSAASSNGCAVVSTIRTDGAVSGLALASLCAAAALIWRRRHRHRDRLKFERRCSPLLWNAALAGALAGALVSRPRAKACDCSPPAWRLTLRPERSTGADVHAWPPVAHLEARTGTVVNRWRPLGPEQRTAG